MTERNLVADGVKGAAHAAGRFRVLGLGVGLVPGRFGWCVGMMVSGVGVRGRARARVFGSGCWDDYAARAARAGVRNEALAALG